MIAGVSLSWFYANSQQLFCCMDAKSDKQHAGHPFDIQTSAQQLQKTLVNEIQLCGIRSFFQNGLSPNLGQTQLVSI